MRGTLHSMISFIVLAIYPSFQQSQYILQMLISKLSVYILNLTCPMQLKCYPLPRKESPKLLRKVASTYSLVSTSGSSCSSDSSDNTSNEYRQAAVKWILTFSKKMPKDTQYLAIAYLNQLSKKAIIITQENYETVAVTCLLVASKMNEIAVPKLAYMLVKCRKIITKEEVIAMEARLLSAFNFDIALSNTPYSHINHVLGSVFADRIQECEKLLRIVATFGQIYQFGDQILAYSIIYLILPQFIKDMQLKQFFRIKTLAVKIYALYTKAKQQYQWQRQHQIKRLK